jgi:hypothetical protein
MYEKNSILRYYFVVEHIHSHHTRKQLNALPCSPRQCPLNHDPVMPCSPQAQTVMVLDAAV